MCGGSTTNAAPAAADLVVLEGVEKREAHEARNLIRLEALWDEMVSW